MCECSKTNQLESHATEFERGLIKIAVNADKWRTLFRCGECGAYWEERLPYSCLQGGGYVILTKVLSSYAAYKWNQSDIITSSDVDPEWDYAFVTTGEVEFAIQATWILGVISCPCRGATLEAVPILGDDLMDVWVRSNGKETVLHRFAASRSIDNPNRPCGHIYYAIILADSDSLALIGDSRVVFVDFHALSWREVLSLNRDECRDRSLDHMELIVKHNGFALVYEGGTAEVRADGKVISNI